MANNLRLAFPNALDLATFIATPTALSTMPVENVQKFQRDRVFRSQSFVSGPSSLQSIAFHWNGDAYRVGSFFLFAHNCHAARIRLQLYDNKERTGSAIYDSGFVNGYPDAFQAWTDGVSSGFTWGDRYWLFGAADPLGPESPYRLYFTEVVAAGGVITIDNGREAMTDPYYQIGRIFLGSYVEAPYQAQYGFQVGVGSSTEQVRSRGGSLRPQVGARWKTMRAELYHSADLDRQKWIDALQMIDLSKDFVVDVFPTDTTRLGRDHCLNGMFSGLDGITFESVGVFTVPLMIQGV